MLLYWLVLGFGWIWGNLVLFDDFRVSGVGLLGFGILCFWLGVEVGFGVFGFVGCLLLGLLRFRLGFGVLVALLGLGGFECRVSFGVRDLFDLIVI